MKYKIGKVVRNYKGGGATTVQSIPDWMRPSIEKVTGQAETQFESGNLSQVAGRSNLQERAFGGAADALSTAGARGLDTLQAQQERLSNMASTPSADVLEAQKQAIVLDAQKRTAGLNTNFGQAGTLGSARQAVLQGAQDAATTGELAKVNADYENKMFTNRLAAEEALNRSVGASGSTAAGTAKTLAELGGQERGITQAQADAGWQGLQRYASTVFGNPARQQGVSGGK
jgi:hypothetical protein